MDRSELSRSRLVVIKIGSRALLSDPNRFSELATVVARLRAESRRVLLVSSGAIALGRERLGVEKSNVSIARLQACAAAGQSELVRRFEEGFAAHGIPAAQVLLTHADLSDRGRYLNARAALEELLNLNAIPIINENDTVAVEEIRFGDNDQLAAMVAALVGADLLLLLTSVNGLLDQNDERVPVVGPDDDISHLLRDETSTEGTGGMRSKVDAARRATRRGVPVVIASADDPDVVLRCVQGQDVGTLFLPAGDRLQSRKHWIAYTLRPKGALVLDEGAVRALLSGKSLLPVGVLGVRGSFEAGDAVRLIGPGGAEVGRGLSRYQMADVARLAGAPSSEIEARLGHFGGEEVVHRNDLVLSVEDPSA